MKIRDCIINYYAILATYIFIDWQESLDNCRGRVPANAKFVIESVFVTYYKVLCDPEKTIHGSTIDEIAPQFQNSKMSNIAESSLNLLEGFDDENAALNSICKKLGEAATKQELDYIISNLTKLDIACSSSNMFIPSIQLSRIGRDIISVLSHYSYNK